MKNIIIKNASWIIACKIVQAILGLIISMLTARYLGPSNFGLISYAASVVAFVGPIMQLGLNGILVMEVVEAKESEGYIIGTALFMSFISSLFCVAGVIGFSAIANAGESETIIVVSLYSILLICQSFELTQYWFQAKYLSKYTSLTMLGAYAIVSIYKILLLITGQSVYFFAVSNAFDSFIISVVLLILYLKLSKSGLHLSKETGKRMILKSQYYIISGLMITIFAQTDRIMLKILVNDSATGYYSAAIACAGLTGFVFSAIIDSARPTIFESKKHSHESYTQKMVCLYCVIIYLSLAQSLFMTFFADIVIKIIYGSPYLPAVPALQIVVWYTTFSYMGSVRNIWMLSEGKQKYLWIINLIGALTNVVLNYIFIPRHGIIGASIASLATQFFTNVVIGYVFWPIKENNRLFVAGLNPMHLVDIVKKSRAGAL